MKSSILLILFAVALLAARALSGVPGASAFWSPVSPVAGCEGLEDLAYAQCCMLYAPDWQADCPADALVPDPVHDAPVSLPPPPERPAKHARHDDAEPVHGEYHPPLCWAVAPGRQLCVWEGIWSAPEVFGVQTN
jgi:hypothetical protein